jgi:hypothetical protein
MPSAQTSRMASPKKLRTNNTLFRGRADVSPTRDGRWPRAAWRPAEPVRIGLAAAGGKDLEVFSPIIGRQLLERGLIDEIDLHIAPVLLGEGIRLYDNPGSEPIRLHRAGSTFCGPGVQVGCWRPSV